MPTNSQRLDNHLILNFFILNLLGFKKFDEIKNILNKTSNEGFREETGHSYYFELLKEYPEIKIPREKLDIYDYNIKEYLDRINKKRKIKISLKYFQYLSLLFTEIYLDHYFQNPKHLSKLINSFSMSFDKENRLIYSLNDLRKIAFWMATGSGKTFLMHINFLQFLRYNNGPHKIEYDNVLLITSNEDLSRQHLFELNESSVPSEIFSSNQGFFSIYGSKDKIKVIDIYKFKKNKKGQGVTIDIHQFGSKNIVLVDEAHKGSGGTEWKDIRGSVANEGFTFEYSATFSQAVSASDNESRSLFKEYSKSILFNYSYKYFHGDGYGKDYRILNLKKEKFTELTRDTLIVSNLLFFYEQKKCFNNFQNEISSYNLEEPLWIFVGGSVTGKEDPDVKKVVEFIDRFIKNENNWATKNIEKILNGNSGLIDKDGRDLFSKAYPENKLKYLKSQSFSPEDIYKDILLKVFNTNSNSELRLVNLKKATGEIALKIGDSPYFGLIYIGDTSGFLKRIKEETNIIKEPDDNNTASLFNEIKMSHSTINMLIGAKKFIEGWDCYRVSTMGLMNIGKKEGSQIIQLFGRGVRLRGKNYSLMRSRYLQGFAPYYIEVMETLNVFGIEANYMIEFKKYLETEGLSTEYISYEIDIKLNEEYLKKELLVPKYNMDEFKNKELIIMQINQDIVPRIDLTSKIDIIFSKEQEGIVEEQVRTPVFISEDYLKILDWDRIYLELLNYKLEREWNNLVFDKNILCEILEKRKYHLICDRETINPKKFQDIYYVEEIALMILKKYLKMYYDYLIKESAKKNMTLEKLTKNDSNINFESYEVKVKESEKLVISQIEALKKSNWGILYNEEYKGIVYGAFIEQHIYHPLLAFNNENDINEIELDITPIRLNTDERDFICDLRSYLKTNRDLLSDYEIYVLRNIQQTGLKIPGETNIFPDFMIWIIKDGKQKLVFVEPHGMAHAWDGLNDPKVALHKHIKDIEKGLSLKVELPKIILESFLISITPYSSIKKIFNNMSIDELEKYNVFFQKDRREEYIGKMFSKILTD